MKKAIFFIYFFLFSYCIFSKNLIISDNSSECKDFIRGFLSENTINKKFILTCGTINFPKYKKYKYPIFSALTTYCMNLKKIALQETKYPSILSQIKIVDNITQRKNVYGILLKNKNEINCFKKLKIKNLKIFTLKKNYEIPYVINKALKSCDVIILYPEKFLKNPLILEFIIKKIILSGKTYIAYEKKFINLGAVAVFFVDYYMEGKRFKKLITEKNLKNKIIFPKYFKVLTTKN